MPPFSNIAWKKAVVQLYYAVILSITFFASAVAALVGQVGTAKESHIVGKRWGNHPCFQIQLHSLPKCHTVSKEREEGGTMSYPPIPFLRAPNQISSKSLSASKPQSIKQTKQLCFWGPGAVSIGVTRSQAWDAQSFQVRFQCKKPHHFHEGSSACGPPMAPNSPRKKERRKQ